MRLRVFALLFILNPYVTNAQEVRIAPWRPPEGDTAARGFVYHPEPILFVHGINASDTGWAIATMPALKSEFSQYDLPFNAGPLTGVLTNLGYNAPQTNY